jgi:hypothetical protein
MNPGSSKYERQCYCSLDRDVLWGPTICFLRHNCLLNSCVDVTVSYTKCDACWMSFRNIIAGSHVRSTVLWYTCYLHPPPLPPQPRQCLKIKGSWSLSNAHYHFLIQLVSAVQEEAADLFPTTVIRDTRRVFLCVYVVYLTKMWGRDSDQHICCLSSWQQLYDVFIIHVIIIIIPYSNPLIK